MQSPDRSTVAADRDGRSPLAGARDRHDAGGVDGAAPTTPGPRRPPRPTSAWRPSVAVPSGAVGSAPVGARGRSRCRPGRRARSWGRRCPGRPPARPRRSARSSGVGRHGPTRYRTGSAVPVPVGVPAGRGRHPGRGGGGQGMAILNRRAITEPNWRGSEPVTYGETVTLAGPRAPEGRSRRSGSTAGPGTGGVRSGS